MVTVTGLGGNPKECRIQTEACWVKVWLKFGWASFVPSMGRLIYLPTWMVDFFYGKLVGKDTSPMDAMGSIWNM